MRLKPTIDSLPGAFAMVQAMRSDGSDWGDGYLPVGPQAVDRIIDREMAGMRDFHQKQLLAAQRHPGRDPPGRRHASFARWLERRRSPNGGQ